MKKIIVLRLLFRRWSTETEEPQKNSCKEVLRLRFETVTTEVMEDFLFEPACSLNQDWALGYNKCTFLKHITKGNIKELIEMKGRRRRRCNQLLDYPKETNGT
jgi:hypothetical protein